MQGAKSFWAPLGGVLGVAIACSWAPTPRIQDAPAPRDYARAAWGDSHACAHHVELLRTAPLDESDYVVVATLSSTCYPGAPGACEQSLLRRACELNADIVVMVEPQAQGTPAGASGQSLSSMTGRAMRRKSSAPAHGDAGPR